MNISETIKALELQKDDLLKKVASIESTIEILRQSVNYTDSPKNGSIEKSTPKSGWDKNSTIKFKINFLLKSENRFLHSREMAEIAHSYEPEVSIDTWLAKFSPQLSSLKRDNKIISIQVGKSLRNTFWGSSKWLNEHGVIIPSFQYNSEYFTEVGASDFKI
jgi:hypothetical protein